MGFKVCFFFFFFLAGKCTVSLSQRGGEREEATMVVGNWRKGGRGKKRRKQLVPSFLKTSTLKTFFEKQYIHGIAQVDKTLLSIFGQEEQQELFPFQDLSFLLCSYLESREKEGLEPNSTEIKGGVEKGGRGT